MVQGKLSNKKDFSIRKIILHIFLCLLHKAWHSWAVMNFECVQFYKNKIEAGIENAKKMKENQALSLDGNMRMTLALIPFIESFIV